MPDWFPYPIRYAGDCGISSRGYSMRGNLAALLAVGITRKQIEVMPWPPSMSLQEDWFFDHFLRTRDDRPNLDSGPRLNVIDVRLAEVRRFWTKGFYNIVVARWGKLPPGAAEGINRCDEVWATSARAAVALRDSGVTVPIFVCTGAVQQDLLETPPKEVAPDIAPEVHPYLGPHEFKHTSPVCFYCIGDTNPALAYATAGWTGRDPVELLIHSVGKPMPRPTDDDAPIIRSLSSFKLKTHGWICKLHRMNHVFVTTRKDFCLSAWEAAVVGNLVVMPDSNVSVPPGAITYEEDRAALTQQLRVAFDLIRSGWVGTAHAIAARNLVSPSAVGEALKQRLTAIKEVQGW